MPQQNEVIDSPVRRTIRAELNDILRKTPLANAQVARISDLLDGGADQAPAPKLGAPTATKAEDLGCEKRYEIREFGQDRRLEEYRNGSSTPFSVPREFYDAFAETVAENSGKYFDEIFRKHPGTAKKDYHGRVVLRFWRSKGLVRNDKGRYGISGAAAEFKRKTAEAWEQQRKK